jgi:hypothetical protein
MQHKALLSYSAALCRYGKFGYGFGRGSYNISAQQYADAVAAVVSAPLASIAADFAALLRQEPMPALLQHYSTAGAARQQGGYQSSECGIHRVVCTVVLSS